MFNATDGASNLTSGNIFHVLAVRNGGFLDVFDDAIFAHTVTTVQDSWQVSSTTRNRIVI